MSRAVLITGASRGIGAACAQLFAENGYRVAVNYNNSRDKAVELCEALKKRGHSAEPFFADIKNEQQIADMVKDVEKAFGGIDVLINNAGISQIKLFTDITADMWDEMFAVNVRGAFLCTREALKGMISRKRGAIINISSMWGQAGASCEVHYSASKAALIGLTKALAKEEALSGITVNCIAPGAVDTDMMRGFTSVELSEICTEIPLGRLGQANEIAAAALFLASEQASFITGQVLGVNGGQVI